MLSTCRFQFVLRLQTKHCLAWELPPEPELVRVLVEPVLVRAFLLVLRPKRFRHQADPSRLPAVRRQVHPNCRSVFELSDPSCCRNFLDFPRRRPLLVQLRQ
jgi:hypothetical protein